MAPDGQRAQQVQATRKQEGTRSPNRRSRASGRPGLKPRTGQTESINPNPARHSAEARPDNGPDNQRRRHDSRRVWADGQLERGRHTRATSHSTDAWSADGRHRSGTAASPASWWRGRHADQPLPRDSERPLHQVAWASNRKEKETEEANEQRVRHALVSIDFFVFTKPILNPYNPFASLTYSFRHNSTRRGARFRPHRSSFAISPREYDRSFASPLSISNVPTPVVELVRRTLLFSNPLSLLNREANRYPP